MKYSTKLIRIIFVAAICAFISSIVGYFVFEMNWPFLPMPILSGIVIALVINEDRVYKYLDKILIGALAYGLLTALFVFMRNYLAGIIYDSGFPFWPFYNPTESFMFALVFSFVCFLGGLVGVVGRGLYALTQANNTK